jgi:branched-chain amino acid transport system permease protein
VSAFFSLEFWTYVGVIAGIYGVLALATHVQFAVGGLYNFGQTAFMAIAAYTMAILVAVHGVPTIPAVLAGLALSIVFGLLLGVPTLRLRADYLAMATIAAGEIIRYSAISFEHLTGGALGTVNLRGSDEIVSYSDGFDHLKTWVTDRLTSIFGTGIPTDLPMLVIVWGSAVILFALVAVMVNSPWGRVLRAVRDDDVAAAAVGKNVFGYRMQVMALGAAIAGFSGLLLAWQLGLFNPLDFLPIITFYAYIIIVVGGLGRTWAIPVGAVLFGLLDASTRFLGFWPLSEVPSGDRAFLRQLIIGLALIGLMMFRPQGLFGKKQEMSFGR